MLMLVFSCSKSDSKEDDFKITPILQTYTLKTSPSISVLNGIIFLADKKYDGFLYELYPNSKDTVSIEGFSNGFLHGMFKKWYPNGQLAEERTYSLGEKNGEQISYWQNGHKRFEFTAQKDISEGEMREWNSDGRLIHLANYTNGQEEGAQKLWYDNGKIRANYVIKDGKRYGLLGTKNCINVSDSIFVVK
jgi:antitoxin component YwqK of YwqJK toxin-antitoxin module